MRDDAFAIPSHIPGEIYVMEIDENLSLGGSYDSELTSSQPVFYKGNGVLVVGNVKPTAQVIEVASGLFMGITNETLDVIAIRLELID